MGTLDGEESMLTKTSIIFCPTGTVASRVLSPSPSSSTRYNALKNY